MAEECFELIFDFRSFALDALPVNLNFIQLWLIGKSKVAQLTFISFLYFCDNFVFFVAFFQTLRRFKHNVDQLFQNEGWCNLYQVTSEKL